LALRTQLQMKSMRNAASEQQQLCELIELGEGILQSRQQTAAPVVDKERIVVAIPSSLSTSSQRATETFEIRFAQKHASETSTPSHSHWTIRIASLEDDWHGRSVAVKAVALPLATKNSN
jgi:hypothetical protein